MSDADYPRPLTLTREDLYELVWSKPMQELAADFGISDAAMAKRCKRLRIPVPGRGYWARVEAGHTPQRPKLPEREEQYSDRSALTGPAPTREPASDSDDGEPLTALEEREGPAAREGEEIRSRIAALVISPAPSVLETLTVVKRTAWYLKYPRRSELVFARGEKTGPIVPIDASEAALDRALLLADSLLRAADFMGWHVVGPEPKEEEVLPPRGRSYGSPEPAEVKKEEPLGQLLVDGERISFRIEERLREEVRVPTAGE